MSLDPWEFFGGPVLYYDPIFQNDWSVDRNEFSYKVSGFTPVEYMAPSLVESWEMPNMQTVILHINQGINWQDKAPVNGREFTAYDVEKHYHRMLGNGSGFTKPSPVWAINIGSWKEVVARDKYTVQITFKAEVNPFGLLSVTEQCYWNYVVAPEVVKEYGNARDWKNAVGTGPYLLTDYVANVSMNFNKNTKYWGHDERYPDNQLPYVDSIKALLIPDITTAIAALRTGKIDIITAVPWQNADMLKQSEPNLQLVTIPTAGWEVDMRCDTAPFTEIKVRKALQMSIDRPTLAKSIYKGYAEGIPCSLNNPAIKGYAYDYKDWSQELKDEYSYNPTKAKALLAEAGFPNGFKTNIIASSSSELDILQAIKFYLLEIGVDAEIKTMDLTTFRSYTGAGKHDQMVFAQYVGYTNTPEKNLSQRVDSPSEYTKAKDPVYIEMYNELRRTAKTEDVMAISRNMEKYALEKHWSVMTFPIYSFNILTPSVKGYSGEFIHNTFLTRMWKD